MTREEAIEVIEQDIPCEYDTDLIEALNMAINALEHPERNVVTVVPCGDTISRQAVIDIVNNPLNIKLDEIVKKLPPVTPQQKTGRWIFKEFDEETGISNSYWCSACNYPMAQVYDDCCAHCGAKMERERRKKNADNT